MIYRLRNILNWVAFVALVVWLLMVAWGFFSVGGNVIDELGGILTFNDSSPSLAESFLACTFYFYPLWVFIQYIIWKHPVFIPWHFKDDEEWD
ncbi:hypothetical protein N9M30_04715 [Pseudomonadales bacterium]|nr:hypothetical protein [Pseudomonadales bacterium]